MDDIYLFGFKQADKLYLTTASAVILFVEEYLKTKSFNLHFVWKSNDPATYPLVLQSSSFSTTSILAIKDCPDIIQDCTLPAVKCCYRSKVLSGLCAVLRYILKTTAQQENIPDLLELLGHKQICLKACAEVSLWTKFCEVDMPNAVDQLLIKSSEKSPEIIIPVELVKLERQFQEPVVIANRSKHLQMALRLHVTETKTTGQHSANSFVALKHNFVEGPNITLADLALLPCISIILDNWKEHITLVHERLPLTLQWVERLFSINRIDVAFTSLHLPKLLFPVGSGELPQMHEMILPNMHDESLAVRQSKMKKFKANSADLQNTLQKISVLQIGDFGHQLSYDIQLSWQNFPEAVHPKDGDLPRERLERKCQQLENLATAVKMIAEPGDTIVDFCAGGGHLGILIAYLLPNCKIILVENKEESIQRAETRIEKLKLTNVTLYQCNLDYFIGRFDIGVCLHACGVATDLVLQCCLDKNASFVICPCCYGNIQNTHTVTYPRSNVFREFGLTYKEYLSLGHGADQTQFNTPAAEQGKLCMMYIDLDRAHLAMEYNYQLTLATLKPRVCSPKNNLLIGRKSS